MQLGTYAGQHDNDADSRSKAIRMLNTLLQILTFSCQTLSQVILWEKEIVFNVRMYINISIQFLDAPKICRIKVDKFMNDT